MLGQLHNSWAAPCKLSADNILLGIILNTVIRVGKDRPASIRTAEGFHDGW